MDRSPEAVAASLGTLPKAPTGVRGLDEITGGGLPRGRIALVSGGPGCGKTLFGLEFLVRGAKQYGEPGLFVSFEETPAELAANVASLGFDLADLTARGLLLVEHVHVERSEIEEAGDYDLEGLFVRLGFAIDRIGARRVVLDTLESLFGGFTDHSVLRAELRRLFRWLKDKGVTAVVTAERGGGQLTRHGLEEYVSDCVLLLDHRISEQISTRRLRVVKYRGSSHGTNEYPFLIDETGLSVFPVTSLGLAHRASEERISTGIERLDTMLAGGCYRGSSILISGTAGTGKSSLAVHFAREACANGERVLYFAFEESAAQILRNMRSIGIDLRPCLQDDLLRFHATRPTLHGLETHLAVIHRQVSEYRPSLVILDPVTNLISAGSSGNVHGMLLRLFDFLKDEEVTAVFTSLTEGGIDSERTDLGVSSLMDVWIGLRTAEQNGERNRTLYVLKARGIGHSNQIREFLITPEGVQLADVYLGPGGVMTGSARHAQETRERVEAEKRRLDLEQQRREIEHRREVLQAQIKTMQVELDREQEKLERLRRDTQAYDTALIAARDDMTRLKRAD